MPKGAYARQWLGRPDCLCVAGVTGVNKMDMSQQDAIHVTYKFVDGLHFFVPADKKAAGLCVANTDLSVAYAEVGYQLTKIAAFNSNHAIKPFVPQVPLETFKQVVEALSAVTNLVGNYDISPSPTQTWVHASEKEREYA
jgi:hypothetical protein